MARHRSQPPAHVTGGRLSTCHQEGGKNGKRACSGEACQSRVKAGGPTCWCRRWCRRQAGPVCGEVSASPGAPRRGWEGGSSEARRGNDLGNRPECGPWPVGAGWAAATATAPGSAGREGRLPQPQRNSSYSWAVTYNRYTCSNLCGAQHSHEASRRRACPGAGTFSPTCIHGQPDHNKRGGMQSTQANYAAPKGGFIRRRRGGRGRHAPPQPGGWCWRPGRACQPPASPRSQGLLSSCWDLLGSARS